MAIRNRSLRFSIRESVPNIDLSILPREPVPHICTERCVNFFKVSDEDISNSNVYGIPQLHGFTRRIHGSGVVYYAPCMRKLSNMDDVNIYLSETSSNATLEMFDFNKSTRVLSAIELEAPPIIKDISGGTEKMPIPVINTYTNECPDQFLYIDRNIISKEVFINYDPGFLTCCDCTDNCSDKRKCACSILTYKSFKPFNPKTTVISVGYKYKRLLEPIISGIYECNSKCPCNSACLNRVGQLPSLLKFNVFKTPRIGWGVRAVHDIPLGVYVGKYVGKLQSGAESERIGQKYGDQYIAELDYIESASKYKPGYEKEVVTDPIRSFYGSDVLPYGVDSKAAGNFTRFINHSCDPNLFSQNVFIDSHDLRFPTVCFFTRKPIPAGHELTWDYGYTKLNIPGKSLYCQCKSSNCRVRLT